MEQNNPLDLKYYIEATTANLKAISRTASDGTIDISSAGNNFVLCKETLSALNEYQLSTLKQNKKALALDVDTIKELTKEELKKIVINNFRDRIESVYNKAQEPTPFTGPDAIAAFIESIAKKLGSKIINQARWFREHEVEKYPYTKIKDLKRAYDDFCDQLYQEINNRPEEITALRDWGKKIAAWVEYRINLTDHFISDSCGKTALVCSAFILMLAKQEIPIFFDKKDYFIPSAIPHKIRVEKDAKNDKQFINWYKYYQSKFLERQTVKNIIANTKRFIENNDYIRAIIDNVIAVSKTLNESAISTTGFDKKADWLEKYNYATKPAILANVTDILETLAAAKETQFDSERELKDFVIEHIVKKINVGILKNDISSERDYFRKNNSTDYPYSDYQNLSDSFITFIQQLYQKLIIKDKDPIETAAWIEYEICFHHHFFIDGNKRIALILSGYYLMKYQLPLPQIKTLNEWLKAAPKTNIEWDSKNIQFTRWYKNYLDLFKKPLQFEIPLRKTHTDPWKISLDEILYLNGSIYKYITRTREEIRDMREATGLDVKELVVFKPERLVLHEIMAYLFIHLEQQDAQKLLSELLNIDNAYYINIQNKIKPLVDKLQTLIRNFDSYVSKVLESYIININFEQNIVSLIEEKKKLILTRFTNNKFKAPISEVNQIIKALVVDHMVKEHLLNEVRQVVKEEIAICLDKNKIPLLPVYKNFERITWAIVGGPAAGKSSLKNHIYELMKFEQNFKKLRFCVVNPDVFKPYLLDAEFKESSDKAAITHEESSYIADLVIQRLWEKIKLERAPHVLLDIVKSSENKMKLARYGGASVNLYIASCPVQGDTGAVSRAFNRANDANSEDYGRYVPTTVVLDGHRQESLLLPETIRESNLSLRLFNTETRKPNLAALIDDNSKTLKILDAKAFIHFIMKSLIQIDTEADSDVYQQQFDAEQLVKLLVKYVESDISLSFKYNLELQNPLIAKLKQEYTEKSDENSYQYFKKMYKKEDTFAILDKTKGFICNDVDTFCKLLKSFDTNIEDFIEEILDIDINGNNKLPVILYDHPTRIKLFEHANGEYHYNDDLLGKLFPRLLLYRRPNLKIINQQEFEAFLALMDKDPASDFYVKAVMMPNLSIKQKLKYLSKSIELNPEYFDAYKHRGVIYELLGRFYEAELDYNQAIALLPFGVELYIQRGNYFKNVNRIDEAIADYTAAIGIATKKRQPVAIVNALFQRGMLYQSIKQYDKALEDYNYGVDCFPNVPEFYQQRCMLYISLKAYSAAIEDYNTTLSLRGRENSSDLHRIYAGLMCAKKNYDEAIKFAEMALTHAKVNHYLVYAELGYIYLKLKDYPQSLKFYEKAIYLAPNNLELLNQRARLYFLLGQDSNAENDIQLVLNLSQDNISTYFKLAEVYSKVGKWDKAIELLDKIIQIDDQCLDAYINLAILNKQTKNLDAGNEFYKKAKALADGNIFKSESIAHKLYLSLARLYRAFDQTSEANDCFNRAIEVSPIFVDAYLEHYRYLLEICSKTEQNKKSKLKQKAKRVKDKLLRACSSFKIDISVYQKDIDLMLNNNADENINHKNLLDEINTVTSIRTSSELIRSHGLFKLSFNNEVNNTQNSSLDSNLSNTNAKTYEK